MKSYYAVIEAGGTKFNCAIVDADRQIYREQRFATTTPEETLTNTIGFFKEAKQQGFDFELLGIASFGPLDLNPQSPTYGNITKTPKPYWSDVALVRLLGEALHCQIRLDTDVNAAALAEYRWGAGQNCDVVIYITVGTGVGGGVVINGAPLHGLVHPEIGHMLLGEIDGISGVCPFHGSCVEGLASGTAMGKIWNTSAELLTPEHKAWDIEAKVLAKLCHNLLMSFSANRIVLGGGVMQQDFLIDKIRHHVDESIASYILFPPGMHLDNIIVPPGLGEKSGLFGALALVVDN